MCLNLEVSQSGYYDWKGRKKSSGKIAKEKLMAKISELFYIKHKQMQGVLVLVRIYMIILNTKQLIGVE